MVEIQNLKTTLNNSIKTEVKNIPKIRIQNKFLGILRTEHKRDYYNPSLITTKLINTSGDVLGKELFELNESNSNSVGLSINVVPEYQKKGFHFGEILRLSSIMMIIENKIKNFEIFSKSTAIYFHTKYKFEPAITNFQERDSALLSVINNCKDKEEYKEYEEWAKDLLQKTYTHKDNETQRNLCKQTNDLLKMYLKKVSSIKDEYKKHPFSYGIKMVLNIENILKNKMFFNKLFENHKIDYKI